MSSIKINSLLNSYVNRQTTDEEGSISGTPVTTKDGIQGSDTLLWCIHHHGVYKPLFYFYIIVKILHSIFDSHPVQTELKCGDPDPTYECRYNGDRSPGRQIVDDSSGRVSLSHSRPEVQTKGLSHFNNQQSSKEK